MFVLLTTITCILLTAVSDHLVANDELAKLTNEWSVFVRPFLIKHCGDCHSDDEANADINFDAFKSVTQVHQDYSKWRNISNQIRIGAMPPDGDDALDPGSKAQILEWIDKSFDLVAGDYSYPGTVTIRKLNRHEYRNTVRDLLGVDFPSAADFPGDDVGYGFNNIADVLSLPPILMEKYLDAAEIISQQAIPLREQMDLEISAASFKPKSNRNRAYLGRLMFATQGSATKRIQFKSAGTYALVINAYGDPAAGEYPKMSVLIDGKVVDTIDVTAKSRKPEWYGYKLKINSSGEKLLQIKFENDYYDPKPDGSEDRNLYVVKAVIRGPKQRKSKLSYLNFSKFEEANAFEFIREFLPRAFRRNVSEDRIQRFCDLYRQFHVEDEDFHLALQKVIQTVLISPQFLYKIEQPVLGGITRNLDSFERATALSYFLWSSTPDDELLRLASNGQLLESKIWAQQTERLLKNTKSKALIENFVAQWLNLELLDEVQPDRSTFANFENNLLADMSKETKLVVADIFERDGSLFEILECDFSFLNQRLAKHYGLEGIDGDFQRVSTHGVRGGVLTHASFLTLTSNPTRTSPVKRGKWIMENILGMEPPPALPDVVPLDDQNELTGSLRERMRQHRTNPSCASCHTTMDALGFALEKFDGVGRFRLKDEGFDIDPRSELPDGVIIDGAEGLTDVLTTTYRDQFVRCFTEKLLTYALGRGVKYHDRYAVNQIISRAAQNEYRISEFIKGVVESEPFLKRGNRKDGIKK